MRDYVFIGWSRNRELAITVKKKLDKLRFYGVIGGDYELNPERLRIRRSSVNETINFQLNHSEQFIMLFQKVDDNCKISENLIYELGFSYAKSILNQGSNSLHVFKIDFSESDDFKFPSNIHGIWSEYLKSDNKDNDALAEEIVGAFLRNQNHLLKKNKLLLLNDYNDIEHDMKRFIDSPSMSEYDFSTLLLLYVQSAFCFHHETDVGTRCNVFSNKLAENSVKSVELQSAVDYALHTMKLFLSTTPDRNGGKIIMSSKTFREILQRYIDIYAEFVKRSKCGIEATPLSDLRLDEDFVKANEFESLLFAQMQEHISYLVLACLHSKNIKMNVKRNNARLGCDYALSAIVNLNLIAKDESSKAYAEMLLSYAYKNLGTFYSFLGKKEESNKYYKESLSIRKSLHTFIKDSSLYKPSLKNYIALEYLLQLVDWAMVTNCAEDRNDCLTTIEGYIEERKSAENNRNIMFNDLQTKCKKLKKMLN